MIAEARVGRVSPQGGPGSGWDACDNPCDLLRVVWANRANRNAWTRRKFRQFACVCTRRVWGLLDERFRSFVVMAERSTGKGGARQRREAFRRAREWITATSGGGCAWEGFARRAVWAALSDHPVDAACKACTEAVWAKAWAEVEGKGTQAVAWLDQAARRERAVQAEAVRDLFPPRGILPNVNADWWNWSRGTPAALARAIQMDGSYELLPILGDALEEAGCTDAAILNHCRGPREHGPGCWVVGLVLGDG